MVLDAARNSLKMGRDVVVDSSNLTQAERLEWINAAKAVADVSPAVVICGQAPPEGEVQLAKVSSIAVMSCSLVLFHLRVSHLPAVWRMRVG